MVSENQGGHGPDYPYAKGEGKEEYAIPDDFHPEFVAAVQDAISRVPEGHNGVWDFGVGLGRTVNLIPSGWRFVGVDVDPGAIKKAVELRAKGGHNGRRTNFWVADLTQSIKQGWALKGRAGLAISSRVLQALPSEQSVEGFLANVRYVLAPGGMAVITAADADKDWRAKRYAELNGGPPKTYIANYAEALELPENAGITDWPLHLFSQDELVARLRDARLRADKVFRYTEPSGFDHLRRRGLELTYVGAVATAV